jgi:type I restriction enzyme S subunit
MLTRTPYARAYFETTATKTTGIASTSATKIKEFRIPLPSLEEQVQLVTAVDERLGTMRAALNAANHQRRLLAAHRRSLIAGTISGQREAA